MKEYIIKDWKICTDDEEEIYEISIRTNQNKKLVFWKIWNTSTKENPKWEACGYSGLGRLKRQVKWNKDFHYKEDYINDIYKFARRLAFRFQKSKTVKEKALERGIRLKKTK